MKKTIATLLIIIGLTTCFAQNDDRPENTGDNFSLEGALALFKKSNSLEEFEQLLNEENNNVNNLDLNNDGTIDYIDVDDYPEGDNHVIVLSTYLSENEKQDIASIGIEKKGAENAILQIKGDNDLYAENTIVEPYYTSETFNGGKGPDVGEYNTTQITINVWLWPSVRYMYGPKYSVWHSPWHWNLYPKWFRPWKPYSYSIFYGRCAPHRMYYHRVPTLRVVAAQRIYTPKRRTSTLVVHNLRGTTIIRKNRRGNIRSVRVRGGGRRR